MEEWRPLVLRNLLDGFWEGIMYMQLCVYTGGKGEGRGKGGGAGMSIQFLVGVPACHKDR